MNRWDLFERMVASLNEAMLEDARWPEVSALIDEVCGAKGSLLAFGHEPSKDKLDVFFAKCFYRGEDRSEWQQEYFQAYYAADEHVPRLKNLPDSKVVHVTDLFSEQELKTSLMYNDALARFEGQNGLNVRLDGPCRSSIVWGIADPIDASGWSSSQIEMVRRVLPHLRQYVRVRTALADAGALGTSVAELLGNSSAGIIHLDREGRIVETNDIAAELLRRNDGLSDQDRFLRAATPEDTARLRELLAQALPRFGGQGASGSMTVTRPSLLPRLVLHVKPVANGEGVHRSRHVAVLALIVDPVSRARIDLGLVETVLGLTPTEAEITVLLTEGRTPRQIAAATGREYSTVRTHLKHIFNKLGVSRQFEVAQLVLAFSNLPGSVTEGPTWP